MSYSFLTTLARFYGHPIFNQMQWIYKWMYPLVNWQSHGKSPCLICSSTRNGEWSVAILNFQRVTIHEDYRDHWMARSRELCRLKAITHILQPHVKYQDIGVSVACMMYIPNVSCQSPVFGGCPRLLAVSFVLRSCLSCIRIVLYTRVHESSYMVVSWNPGTPSYHPYFSMIFHYKPTFLGYPMTMETPTSCECSRLRVVASCRPQPVSHQLREAANRVLRHLPSRLYLAAHPTDRGCGLVHPGDFNGIFVGAISPLK